jgi:hypothetical protein
MARRVFRAGVLVEEWRDAPDYAVYDGAGVKVRDYTAAERAQADQLAIATVAGQNAQTLTDRAAAALAGNATFLAIASPSNAQVVAQVRALTRQVNALIRLEIRALADVSDS